MATEPREPLEPLELPAPLEKPKGPRRRMGRQFKTVEAHPPLLEPELIGAPLPAIPVDPNTTEIHALTEYRRPCLMDKYAPTGAPPAPLPVAGGDSWAPDPQTQLPADIARIREALSAGDWTAATRLKRLLDIAIHGEDADSMKAIKAIDDTLTEARAALGIGMADPSTLEPGSPEWSRLVGNAIRSRLAAGDMDAVRLAIAAGRVREWEVNREGKQTGAGTSLSVTQIFGDLTGDKEARLVETRRLLSRGGDEDDILDVLPCAPSVPPAPPAPVAEGLAE